MIITAVLFVVAYSQQQQSFSVLTSVLLHQLLNCVSIFSVSFCVNSFHRNCKHFFFRCKKSRSYFFDKTKQTNKFSPPLKTFLLLSLLISLSPKLCLKLILASLQHFNLEDIGMCHSAKKVIFTACHLGKLKLAFTSPNVISTCPPNFLMSRIDFTVLL